MRRGWIALLLCVGVHESIVSAAFAEDAPSSLTRSAPAEVFFQEGLRLMKEDDCQRATPKFLSSQELDPSAATLLNIATCYARLGRTGSAWRTYRLAAEAATTEGNDDLRQRAARALSLLTPSLTQLSIVGAGRVTDAAITLNGHPLVVTSEPIPIDPGENIVEVNVPGRRPWRRTINASEPGTTTMVDVPELAEVDHHEGLRTAAIAVGGGALAAVVVGSIFGLSARSSADDMRSNCRDGKCNAAGIDSRNDAERKATTANYAFGAGAVLAATGAGLWIASSAHSDRGVAIAPWAPSGPAGVGLSVRGKM